jgi:Zn-dependent M32 family carboxypeptidase
VPYSPSEVVPSKSDPQAEQLQLANVTLQAVDRLTGMTADEIEQVAEQVIQGAEETAAVLRELARRVRENGMFANERLARFVKVANQCADIARSMQASVELRDDQHPPEPRTVEAGAEHQAEGAVVAAE